MKYYFVYILKCIDGSYYTGVTNDIEKRLAEQALINEDWEKLKRLSKNYTQFGKSRIIELTRLRQAQADSIF